MKQLIYQIAEEIVILHTPKPEETREILPNFEPFLISSIPAGKKAILEVYGDEPCSIEAEGDTLVEHTIDYQYCWTLYKSSQGLRAVLTHLGNTFAFVAEQDWSVIRCGVSMTESQTALYLNRFILIAYGVATTPLGYLKVHASVTELAGRALIFLGVSGTGKSTHSRLWREHIEGCTLLNDDEPIVRVMPDGSVRVYGAPWSGSTPCYRNESAEVVAFVHLHQSPVNQLTKKVGRDAFNSLFSSVAFLHTDRESQFRVFNAVANVLERIPVYHLDCRPDKEAVMLTYSLLNR